MIVKITIDGPTNRTLEFIKHNSKNARQAVRQTFFRMGRELKKKTNADILDKTTKTGHIYWVRGPSGRRRRHQASSPGETHANLSGTLRRSIGWQVHGTDHLEFGYGLTRPAPPYADRIEHGGWGLHDNWIDARPSLMNNIKKVNFQKYFDEALSQLEGK